MIIKELPPICLRSYWLMGIYGVSERL